MNWPNNPNKGDIFSPDDGVTLYEWTGHTWLKLTAEERLKRLEKAIESLRNGGTLV
jgi:hypothetical protein